MYLNFRQKGCCVDSSDERRSPGLIRSDYLAAGGHCAVLSHGTSVHITRKYSNLLDSNSGINDARNNNSRNGDTISNLPEKRRCGIESG